MAKIKIPKGLGSELIAFAKRHGVELQEAATKDATFAGKLAGKKLATVAQKAGENAGIPLLTAGGVYAAEKLSNSDHDEPPKKRKKRPYLEKEDP